MNAGLLSLRFPCGRIELECPPEIPAPPTSSIELARNLPKCSGASVLDLGCGIGLFAVVAAKSGAREVWAVDADPIAAAAARRNVERNRVSVHVEEGDWFQPVGDRRFDLIVTNPPQTPAPPGASHPKFGGPDGLLHFRRILADAPRHLAPGGQLLTLVLSIADTREFRAIAEARFRLEDLGRRRRDFTPSEYEGYHPGLFAHLADRRRLGGAEFEEDAGGWYFWIRYFRARPCEPGAGRDILPSVPQE